MFIVFGLDDGVNVPSRGRKYTLPFASRQELVMDGQATSGVLRFFSELPDPRAHNVIHKLHDIFLAAFPVMTPSAGSLENLIRMLLKSALAPGLPRWPSAAAGS